MADITNQIRTIQLAVRGEEVRDALINGLTALNNSIPTNTSAESPTVTVTEITDGHRLTITDKDHPGGQTFDIMDGVGSGDMLGSVYDPGNTVASAGGIVSYVNSVFATLVNGNEVSY